MTQIEIEKPNGYLFDSDGNVCLRFGNWDTGVHEVPDYVDGRRSPEYVSGPASFDKPLAEKYKENR